MIPHICIAHPFCSEFMASFSAPSCTRTLRWEKHNYKFVAKCFYSFLKIYTFRNIVHFSQTHATSCRYCRVLAKRIVIFRKRSTQSEFLDVFYCGHVAYQIWALFETFKGNVNQTNTVNFDAHWTSGAKKGGFEIS